MIAPGKGKRLYLINRDFQLRYTRAAALVGIASTALTLFLVLFPLFQMNVIRFPNFLPAPFLWAIGFAAVLNVAIIVCLGVLITHRIAGPMFSLVRHIHMMQSGRLQPPLKVRKGDDLKYLVRSYNELVDYLRWLAAEDKDQLDAVIDRLRTGQSGEALELAQGLQIELATRIGDDDGTTGIRSA